MTEVAECLSEASVSGDTSSNNTVTSEERRNHHIKTAERYLLNADEVAEMLGVAKNTAYSIIRDCNEKLAKAGKLVVRGRVNKQYLLKTLDVSDIA